jgi:dicarboxylate transporter 10
MSKETPKPAAAAAAPAAAAAAAPVVKVDRTKRQARWYHGGLAGTCAAGFTHPLDLIKVQLQTQQKAELGMVGMAVKVVKSDGFFALYSGISAGVLRQLTYTLTRFGVYEMVKNHVANTRPQRKNLSFAERLGLAGGSGFVGAIVGNFADVTNVRMQNDVKLPKEQRRNYKHVFDAMTRVIREEGVLKLFNGVSMNSFRGALMTIGQIAFYDQVKQMMIQTGYFKDTVPTHLSASIIAATMATILTQPADVVKTRLMNAKPGEYSGLLQVFAEVGKNGPQGFFKGFIPAFIRLAPHTILLFIFFEQIRMAFGDDPQSKK